MRVFVLSHMAIIILAELIAPSICAGQNYRARQWFDRAIEAEEPQEKLRCLNNAIEADSRLWQAWAVRAETRITLNAYEEAKADASHATTLAPNEFVAWAVLARAHLVLGEHTECISAATTAFGKQGNSSVAAGDLATLYVFRAEAYRVLHQETSALQDLNLALQKDPKCILALDRRVSLLVATDRQEDATDDCEYLERLVQRSPDDIDLRMALATAQYLVDRDAEAVQTANTVLTRRPDFVPAFLLRGRAQRYLKQYHAALEDFKKVEQLAPDNLDAHYEQGMVYALLKQFEKAESHFAFVLDRVPAHVPAYTVLAQVHLEQKEWDSVIDDANRILNMATDDQAKATAYHLAGIALRRMRNLEGAKDCFDKALGLNPKLADALFERALVHSDQGNPAGAVSDCDNGLAIASDSAYGYLIRGRAYSQMYVNSLAPSTEVVWNLFRRGTNSRLHEKAIADLERVPTLAPGSHLAAWSYVSLANLAREKEDHDKAILWATRGIDMPADPDSQPEYMDPISIAYVIRAASRRVQRKNEEALDDCTCAIKLDEKYAGAYVERAGCLRALHKYDLAIEDCAQAIHLQPFLLRAYLERGFASLEKYRGEGVELAGTVEELPPILRDMSGHTETPRHIGKARISGLQNVEGSTAENLETRPYVPEPVVQTVASREQHPLDRAIEDFGMSLNAGHEVLASARGLAQCLAEQGRLKEANQVCDSALLETSGDAGETELHLVRATVRYALGNVEGGLADSQAAANEKGDSAEAHLLEGYGYAMRGEWKQCEAKCLEGLDLDSESHVVARLLLLWYTAKVRHDDLEKTIQVLASRVQRRNMSLQAWPGPIVQALIEKQRFQQFAATLSAESEEHIKKRRLCEVLYYFGVRDYTAGKIGQAKDKWGGAIELGARQHIEFILTAADLHRLGS